MSLSLPKGHTVFNLVRKKFEAAKAANSLVFSPTELAIVHPNNVPFQLRYCPSLARKPTPEHDKEEANGQGQSKAPKPDPFANPPEDLLVASLPVGSANPSHILVLNKYPVIQQHFILATTASKQQTHWLEEDDLAMTYACLQAWEEDGQNGGDDVPSTTNSRPHKPRRLFAFFNSGEHSGASQTHRHIQFLPVEAMEEQQPRNSDWQLLVDNMPNSISEHEGQQLYTSALPIQHCAIPIPPNLSPSQLLSIYKRLYDNALRAVQAYAKQDPTMTLHDKSEDKDALPISYNLALSTKVMAICARRSAGTMLKDNDGTDPGFVALNGTILGATLMVKEEKQWDLLRGAEGDKKLAEVLRAVGVPWQTPAGGERL